MKGRSILEASLIFLILQFLLLYPTGVRDLIRWENNALGGSYLTGVLLIALGVFLVVYRRYEFRLMGVATENLRLSLNYGIRGYLFFLIPQFVLSFFLSWDAGYRDYIVVSFVLGFLVLVVSRFMLKKVDVQPASNRRLFLAGLLLATPHLLALFHGRLLLGLLKIYLWNIVVGGFAEEFFYRGVIQSSVDLEYGKGIKIGNASIGPGLLVSAALYGLSRGMRTMRPWSGVYSVSWGWTIYAFTLGIFYGLIREASGDIVASGTANGMIDAIGEALRRLYLR